jgi:hypothetical protein
MTQPPHTLFEQAVSDPGWVPHGGGVYRFPVGELDYHAGGELLFVVTLTTTLFTPSTQSFDASVSIADDGWSGEDDEPGNNFYAAPLGVPDLLIERVVAQPAIWAGHSGFLTVTIRNNGTGPACSVFYWKLGCTSFVLDIFRDPERPPASYPYEKPAECFAFVAPIAPSLTKTVVISFTALITDPGWRNQSGLCGAASLSEVWLKVDNWGPLPEPFLEEFGLVPEFDEYDNTFVLLAPEYHVYLPVFLHID